MLARLSVAILTSLPCSFIPPQNILTTTAVLAALVAAVSCDAQSNIPRPRPFRPSFPSTPSSFHSTGRPSDEPNNTIFSTDSDKSSFPGSSSFGSGQPGGIFVSSQGFGNPSTSFGTPAPTTFGSQGGAGVFGQPTVFGTPVTIGTALPRQGGTTFNTGLGSGTTSGSSGRFPTNTQFGTLNPGSFGGAIPVIVGFTQGGLPVQGFLQGPVGFSQTPSGVFSQVPVNSFGQSVVPLGFGQAPVNSFPGSANVPTVFPPPPVSTNLDTHSGGIFDTISSDHRRRPSFGSSSSSSGSSGSSSSNTGSTLIPRFPLPNQRVFGKGKSGSSSDPTASASSTSTTKTEKI
ncbi:hypothetical protein E2C01_076436 [Portunus trituberculatus]|uniref:Uncharacterized protein n=1 Tax=Portunus trituberculatus TaxID=210409 RepID=A0A5B7I8Q4_PORTR|nr:hypothetical protein [Portunus trituberculatus]